MVDDEKPFPCSSPGCSMRFANEDHLSIHKKRHMSLSIESISNNGIVIADETPTPTRFIRNCEEVGLFQDLNVNPFDEQFRRAAETHLSPPSLPTSDDVLHTPHVFPVLPLDSDVVTQLLPPKSANVRKNYLMPSLSTSECLTLPSPATTPVPTPLITVTAPTTESQGFFNKRVDTTTATLSDCGKTISTSIITCSSRKDRTKKNNTFQSNCTKTATNPTVNIMPRPIVQSSATSDPMTSLLLRLPDGRLVQIPAIPVPTETDASKIENPAVGSPLAPVGVEQSSCKIKSARPVMSEAKLKLKQALTKAKPANQPLNGNSPCGTSDASGTDTEPLTNADSVMDVNDSTKPNNRRRVYNSASDQDLDEEESEKRRRFLERNRAAAFRSRQKRKRWVTNLEAKTTVMNTANKLLQNEVLALRSEVAQLKLQLLAHKDCPVTLAMCQHPPVSGNSVLIAGNQSRGVTVNSTNSNSAVSSATPRQIIILNTSNQNSTSFPITAGNKDSHTSLIMVPRVETNIGPNNCSVVNMPNPADLGQQTSVIMSVKNAEN
ncbi:hypothetical protein DAPPUDRAFT_324326 [Daphnia pulex]|uniref:Cyclic AMP-dependent transcription factor ATF-2 n=1 Tax=Daphnia pulex TaxID=6669 RepID=E9H1K5_DAPPU|nr:hypothetical protein DAPPUDRAFT_324326 [Daphnia pulex]|eukprot:EFX74489.1 hypothetical protein DAPPUDRAFT_324326 [Daphnia pulex]